MSAVADRRTYQRRYAARRQAERLARANLHATHCQRRHGPGVCGGTLTDRVDRALGRVVRECPRCARRLAGICRDCPLPVYGQRGKAIRCAVCAKRAQDAAVQASKERHHEENLARAKARYQNDPEVRARRNAYKRLYRKLRRDQVAKEKRRAGITHNKAREKMLAYHRRYNAARRAHKAAVMAEQYRAGHPVPQPTCASCQRSIPYLVDGVRRPSGEGRPPRRCVFCMKPAEVRQAALRWAARTDRELQAPAVPKPKPVRPWKPKVQPTRLTAAGERLCWTADCPQVVRGREKKCAACKTRETAEAARLLAMVAGRGRRTDLARRPARREVAA